MLKVPSEKSTTYDFTTDELHQSQIMRFDYIVRKVMKICNSDSTENFNEQTVDQVWFLTLDKVMQLKNTQLKLLETLKP